MAKAERARMNTEERREQLLGAGAELLRRRPFEEVSIDEIAAAAGVSKGLLYHYFPTKKDFILAALKRGQAQLAQRLRPDPDLGPETQLLGSIDAFLDYVEEYESAYVAIFSGRGGEPEYAAALDAARGEQMETLFKAMGKWSAAPVPVERTPVLEAAIQGWLFFVEGAILRWLQHGGLERRELRALLASALNGSVIAAGVAQSLEENPAPST
jgi:AcrR family transcriptional regulator